MRIIRIKADIDCLRHGGPFGEAFLQLLESHFRQLAEGLGNGVPATAFSLAEHGPLVVVEPGDPSDLRTVGIHGDITVCCPEYVDVFDVGQKVYRVAVLMTNDFLPFIYIPAGSLSRRVDKWLARQAGENDNEAPIPTTGIGTSLLQGRDKDGERQ